MEEEGIRHGLRYHFEASDGRTDGHIFLTVLDGQRAHTTRSVLTAPEESAEFKGSSGLNRHKCQKFRDISHAGRPVRLTRRIEMWSFNGDAQFSRKSRSFRGENSSLNYRCPKARGKTTPPFCFS